jgi:LacI family transcriptional regulator
VPDDVAVLGVDNETVICEHTYPTLSSVARNDLLEGYSAAALLDRLIRKRTTKQLVQTVQTVPPVQVVQRESTATFAVSDPRLKEALTFIHDNLVDLISVDDISRRSNVSRRWLEYAFRESLGETPYQYLRRQRLGYARQLLVDDPQAKLLSVAQRSGFSSGKQLTVAFQQEFGVCPSSYRRTMRPNGS